MSIANLKRSALGLQNLDLTVLIAKTLIGSLSRSLSRGRGETRVKLH